jgi:putative redox protein
MTPAVKLHSRGSFQNEVEAGTHRFVIDEPVSAGGTDSGPTPYDLLAAAVGGCTSMTLHFYAQREKIPLEGVDVEVTHDREYARDCADCISTNGFIHRFTLKLGFHGPLSDEQRETLLGIAKRCPVAKTLANEIRIDHVAV